MSNGAPRSTLNTWKEISSYLDVSLRTAQSWKKDRGLPVMRYPGIRAGWPPGPTNSTPGAPALNPRTLRPP